MRKIRVLNSLIREIEVLVNSGEYSSILAFIEGIISEKLNCKEDGIKKIIKLKEFKNFISLKLVDYF